jgi:hypothetical protein
LSAYIGRQLTSDMRPSLNVVAVEQAGAASSAFQEAGHSTPGAAPGMSTSKQLQASARPPPGSVVSTHVMPNTQQAPKAGAGNQPTVHHDSFGIAQLRSGYYAADPTIAQHKIQTSDLGGGLAAYRSIHDAALPTPTVAPSSQRSSDWPHSPLAAGGVADMSEVPLLPLSSVTQRLKCGRWLWAGALHVDDLGLYRYSLLPLMSVNN